MLTLNKDFLLQHELHFPFNFQGKKLIFINDMNHRVVGANLYTAHIVGFPSLESLINNPLYYNELPCNAQLLAESFIFEDKKVKNDFIVRTIARVGYAHDIYKVIFTEKMPLFNNKGELVAYLCICIDIANSRFFNVHTIIGELNIAPIMQGQFSLIIKEFPEEISLTSRETECLFYLLRGNSCGKIAEILKLSTRTIESYIDNLKNKMLCDSKQQLIEKSMSSGYASIIPESILHAFTQT